MEHAIEDAVDRHVLVRLPTGLVVARGAGDVQRPPRRVARVDPQAHGGEALATALRPGDVVVLDNLRAHRTKGVEAVEAQGATLLYLPTYSLHLWPIEPMWSKAKQGLRSVAAPSTPCRRR